MAQVPGKPEKHILIRIYGADGSIELEYSGTLHKHYERPMHRPMLDLQFVVSPMEYPPVDAEEDDAIGLAIAILRGDATAALQLAGRVIEASER